ncbi:MAG: hypothetical protein HQL19_05710 [Candidatus Omnitrophica bacterium]|nr:hypothetical protein [Candidatus Omnitrophota bacterium]
MKKFFSRVLPLLFIIVAVCFLFLPKSVSWLEVEKFFSDTDPYFVKSVSKGSEDYYAPGVRIGKLWAKLGVKPKFVEAHSGGGFKDASGNTYMFGCSAASPSNCVLTFPTMLEIDGGGFKALRVSTSGAVYSDYQYLLFRKDPMGWNYFAHIDVFDNKTGEPDFRFLPNGRILLKSLAGRGDGFVTQFIQVFEAERSGVKLLLAMPSDGERHGLGMLEYDFSSNVQQKGGQLALDYTLSFSGTVPGLKLRPGDEKKIPFFSLKKKMAFRDTPTGLLFVEEASDMSKEDVFRIIAGSYAAAYKMFRAEFDRLEQAGQIQREWLHQFMKVVSEESSKKW